MTYGQSTFYNKIQKYLLVLPPLLVLIFIIHVIGQSKTLANGGPLSSSALSGNQQTPSVELTPRASITETNNLLIPSRTEQNQPNRIDGDGTTSWEQLFPTVSPSARAEMGFVYDSDRGVIVAIGGSYGFNTKFTETWGI